jgi:hypothetical protein
MDADRLERHPEVRRVDEQRIRPGEPGPDAVHERKAIGEGEGRGRERRGKPGPTESRHGYRGRHGEGRCQIAAGDGTDRLLTTHAYEPGEFDVIVTARVTGQAYSAFFTPDGVPYEEVVPFELDISNRTSGVAAKD